MSLTREQIRNWRNFKTKSPAPSVFIFSRPRPRNKAHKEDTILIKDLVREALRNLESKVGTGKKPKDNKEGARADLDRILRLSE